jgi:hypothetical protein
MSHVASLISVVLLFVSIGLNAVSVTQVWWKKSDTLGYTKITLWEVKLNTPTAGGTGKLEWDQLCDAPSTSKEALAACGSIKAMRAFLILGAVFAFMAATGNAAGIYTGNTLIDSAAGVVAGFSALFSGVGIGMGALVQPEGLTSGSGFLMACIACGLQLLGGFMGCVGTCQEIHDLTRLAASMHIGEYQEPEAYKPRSERSGKIREAEAADTAIMCENLKKRKKQAEAAAAKGDASDAGEEEEDEDEKKKKKVPVMLKRVLFRKPEDGEDDEIPTKWLEDAFAEIDGDGSGSIELDELVDSLRLCGLAVSATATDIVMKEIDKNASGDVDLREFIEFFRHIEDLNRFEKKSGKRKQCMSFLLNFCFLADIVVVGVMLMMFIRMDEAENPDNYSILKNVLMACSFFLGILFLLVILIPILRMALGPSVNKMQKQYELAQEIKQQQRKDQMALENSNDVEEGPREAGYGPGDPPPPVNAAMFGRSYRPGKVDSSAWTPAIDDMPASPSKKAGTPDNAVVSIRDSKSDHRASTKDTRHSSHSGDHRQSSHGATGGRVSSKGGHTASRSWRYDPANYRIAIEHAQMLESADLGPSGWAPMQMRDVNIPKQTAPALLPGAPLALTDAAFPQSTDAR